MRPSGSSSAALHPLSPVRVTALLCIAEILSMTSSVAYPALLPTLRDAWSISNSAAGLISGSYFAGYMVAVPILTSITDRIDARRVYLFATLLAAVGALGFGLFARGAASAVLFQVLAGAGLAGTYMPGLRILSDHIEGRRRNRYIAFYTSSFGLGTSASLLLTGAVAAALGWQAAFMLLALGPALAGVLVILVLPPAPTRAVRRQPWLDFRPVLRNGAATSYIVGYAAHCWELFGLRSWLVAFLAFSASLQATDASHVWSAAAAAAVINLLGPIASILGNELAGRGGRRRTIAHIMRGSALMALVVGFAAPLPWLVVFALVSVYFLLVMGDSAALTAGLIAAADPQRRGAAMALHSFMGFGAGFVAPLVFGVVLDSAGGGANPIAWGLAFVSLGLGAAVGPLGFALYERRTRRRHLRAN